MSRPQRPAPPALGPGGDRDPLPTQCGGRDPAVGGAGRAQASHERGQLVPITAPLAPFRQPRAMGKPSFGGAGGGLRHPAPSLALPTHPPHPLSHQSPGAEQRWRHRPAVPLDALCLSFPFRTTNGPSAATRDPVPSPLPLGSSSPGQKPPEHPSTASSGLLATRGTPLPPRLPQHGAVSGTRVQAETGGCGCRVRSSFMLLD